MIVIFMTFYRFKMRFIEYNKLLLQFLNKHKKFKFIKI
jgi:hypothetical protein